ncbi:EF-hand domain-containing protein [Dyella flagellata]|nr:EF-hand domain-containing protein [Dyella flagellata]
MRKILPIVFVLIPSLVPATPQSGWDGKVSAQQRAREFEQKFDQANTTHDGKLTLDQAKAGMPRLAEHFDEIDTDHRGYVTLEQVEAYFTSRRNSAAGR